MISAADYEFLKRLLKAKSGLIVTDGKDYLLESRLAPVAAACGLADIAALVARLKQPGSQDVERRVVDAMTTNESFFFRDRKPFESFSDMMLPALMQARPAARPIRIWCAAASSGQEPYSLAMLIRENGAKLAGRRFEIVATDLSDEMLARARDGVYSQFEVQRGLPVQMLLKYFRKDGEQWRISPDLVRMVEFRNLNLLAPFSHLGVFDIVFCRNVLIYFDNPTKSEILGRILRGLRPDGYLVLGGAETVVGLSEDFVPAPGHRNVYTLRAAAAGGAGLSAAQLVAAQC